MLLVIMFIFFPFHSAWDFPSTLNQWKSSAKGGGESRRALPTCQSVGKFVKNGNENQDEMMRRREKVIILNVFPSGELRLGIHSMYRV